MTQTDGTLVCGPLDVLVVLRNESTGLFHPALLIEVPLPGQPTTVTLREKFHQITGLSWIDAQRRVVALAQQFGIPANNIAEAAMPWDGDWPFAIQVGNWIAGEVNVGEMMAYRHGN